jgi:hypothetical protein
MFNLVFILSWFWVFMLKCLLAYMFTNNHDFCQTFSFENIMADKKMFSTRIDPDLLKELKHLSVDSEKSLSDLTEEAIKALLDKYKKPKK